MYEDYEYAPAPTDEQRWKKAGLFRQYFGVTEWDISRGDKQAWERVTEYIDHLTEHRYKGRGLLLIGVPGLGKTLAVNLVGRAILKAGFSLRCMEMADYIKKIQRHMNFEQCPEDEWHELDRVLFRMEERDAFVILDDVGKEYSGSGSGWSELKLDYLMRHRYNLGRPTILTSNIPLEKWDGRYNDSMASFIHEACFIVTFRGADQRTRK